MDDNGIDMDYEIPVLGDEQLEQANIDANSINPPFTPIGDDAEFLRKDSVANLQRESPSLDEEIYYENVIRFHDKTPDDAVPQDFSQLLWITSELMSVKGKRNQFRRLIEIAQKWKGAATSLERRVLPQVPEPEVNPRGKSESEIKVLTQFGSYGETNRFDMRRMPPQDTELEGIILGIYMKDPQAMRMSNQKYVNTLWYRPPHIEIHKAMMNLGPRTNLMTLQRELAHTGQLEAVGGRDYLEALAAVGVNYDSGLIKNYVDWIAGCATARNFIVLFTDKIREIYDSKWGRPSGGASMDQIEAFARKSAKEILEKLPKGVEIFGDFMQTKYLAAKAMGRLRQLRERGGAPKLSTAYPQLDRITHGIKPNKLIIAGARPKQGKTAFSLNIARNVAAAGHHVLYFTYESSRDDLIDRLWGMEAGVNSEKLEYYDKENTLTDEEFNKLTRVRGTIDNLLIDFQGGRPDLDLLLRRAEHYKVEHPDCALIVVDQLHSFRMQQYQSKTEYFSEVLKAMKSMADDLQVTVWLNAQLGRDVEKRVGRRPGKLGDVADCKGGEECADVLMHLYRPEFYATLEDWKEPEKYAGWAEVIPVAVRTGDHENRAFKLGFDKTTGLFSNYTK